MSALTQVLHSVVEAQRTASVVILDCYGTLDIPAAQELGVSFHPEKLLFVQPATLEDAWKMLVVGMKTDATLFLVLGDLNFQRAILQYIPARDLSGGTLIMMAGQ